MSTRNLKLVHKRKLTSFLLVSLFLISALAVFVPEVSASSSLTLRPTANGTYQNMSRYGESLSGCVLLLPMDEGVGTTTYDQSGNGNNGNEDLIFVLSEQVGVSSNDFLQKNLVSSLTGSAVISGSLELFKNNVYTYFSSGLLLDNLGFIKNFFASFSESATVLINVGIVKNLVSILFGAVNSLDFHFFSTVGGYSLTNYGIDIPTFVILIAILAIPAMVIVLLLITKRGHKR